MQYTARRDVQVLLSGVTALDVMVVLCMPMTYKSAVHTFPGACENCPTDCIFTASNALRQRQTVQVLGRSLLQATVLVSVDSALCSALNQIVNSGSHLDATAHDRLEAR